MTNGGRECRRGRRKGERKGSEVYAWPLEPVCFRSMFKDYPFISSHILVSVVTQREARRILSCGDLRIMRASVPGPKCLSGLTDNASEISVWDKICTAIHAVATTLPCAARQISDKILHTTDVLYKLIE